MKTRLFYTTGKRDIIEEEWDKPEPNYNEIEVKAVLTGVCRSDIDMYNGTFQTLPKQIQGHEGLGIVTKVGGEVHTVSEGDYVATRGEPAFADYYNCRNTEFVKVPSASPKYIIEPVACAINIAMSFEPRREFAILLLGSGFLSTIVHSYMSNKYKNKFVVVGNANKDYWSRQSNVTMETVETIRNTKFKYVIDLSDKPEYLNLNVYAECATIVLAAEKHPKVNTSFAEFLWNAVDVKFPSPRNTSFYRAMEDAVFYVKHGRLETESLWTKSYNRDTEVKLAFEEGLAGPAGYSRGYIEWQK